LNLTVILAEKKYFYFSRIISQELFIASLFIIKVILNPFSATFMYSAQEIFQHLFQCNNVCTILNKIQYEVQRVGQFVAVGHFYPSLILGMEC
jgi:hypothetical protein